MTYLIKSALAVSLLASLAACGGDNVSTPPQGGPVLKAVQVTADFNQGIDGWKGDSSDYSAADAPENVVFEQRALGAPLSGKGYYVAGTNRSDDLFLYVKKQFGGFVPSASYKVMFTVKFATDVPTGCMGVGGSPGESVWVFGAASDIEPKNVVNNGRTALNIDRGNQGGGGKAGQMLGTIGNSVTDCGKPVMESKTLKSKEPLTVKADAEGKLWLLVGIDSGFEAASKLTFQSVVLDAEPVK
ncbi:hypothetical protein GCM10027277_25160 [Pseudoduganella ginsengisoli]|uniref:PEP-CTERM sorting domain-containing protein n=1 Tax=Pseudoduganella ginsengisoli TaxID=1462440 RepID=A0A6L6Q0A9_9BURK|nr:hypothetical protein [Pseudoduganella ginsengisoli]MTW02761.1 hypothetical protein [Pseudoduganella ginsengisoli]